MRFDNYHCENFCKVPTATLNWTSYGVPVTTTIPVHDIQELVNRLIADNADFTIKFN